MYVKALHDDGRSSIREVTGEVHTGHYFGLVGPSAQEVLGFDHWDFSALWENSTSPTGKANDAATKSEVDCWELRWAWWREDGMIQALITPYHIYVLGDDGRTIDRV